MSDVDRHELLCKEEIKLLESMEGVEQTKNDINDGKQLNCDKITKESCQLNSDKISIQFVSESGEAPFPPFEVPKDISPSKLLLVLKAFLREEEEQNRTYLFFVNNQGVSVSLAETLKYQLIDYEATLSIVYKSQASTSTINNNVAFIPDLNKSVEDFHGFDSSEIQEVQKNRPRIYDSEEENFVPDYEYYDVKLVPKQNTEGFGEWNPEANKPDPEPRENKREERRRERKSRWGDLEEVTEYINNSGLESKDVPSTPPGDDLANVNMDQDNEAPINENFEAAPVDHGHNENVPEENNFFQVGDVNDHNPVSNFDGEQFHDNVPAPEMEQSNVPEYQQTNEFVPQEDANVDQFVPQENENTDQFVPPVDQFETREEPSYDNNQVQNIDTSYMGQSQPTEPSEVNESATEPQNNER